VVADTKGPGEKKRGKVDFIEKGVQVKYSEIKRIGVSVCDVVESVGGKTR